MSSIASPRTGWWRPEDCVLWRSADGTGKAGLTADARQLLGIAIVDITASIDAPWEMTIKEYIKPGHGGGTDEKVYGLRYFEPEQELWLTDRFQAPTTAGGPGNPDSTRFLFYGKIVNAAINLEDQDPHYLYRVVDRRFLMRRVPVTLGGPHPADSKSSQGPSRLVFNPPPGDVDAGFDPLGGSRNTILAILEKYFDLHANGLLAHAGVNPNIDITDFHGWKTEAQTFTPGKISIEDANFEEGLIQILGAVPHVRFYVDPLSARVQFVSPLRLSQTLKIEMPSEEEPTRDWPIGSSWNIDTENVYTAVRITAKTGKIKNNWTRMISGFGSPPEETSSGASVIPLQAPAQPGVSVNIKVSNAQSAYYEDWALMKTTIAENYWNYAGGQPNGLPVDGSGQPQPIYMLNMWNKGFEQDFRGDSATGTWTGYKQTAILAGHYHGGSGQVAGQNCTMIRQRYADVPVTFRPIGANGAFDFQPFDPGSTSYIYKLTDTEKFWRTLGMTEDGSGGVVNTNRRRRRGPWTGGRLILPPQPGVPRPAPFEAAFGPNEPIKFDIQMSNGSDLWVTVVTEQQPYIHYNTFAGEIVGSKWFYEVREPGNKLTGPKVAGLDKIYTTGGRWSAMFQVYRAFDPEMVWQFVNSHGGTNRPKFASYAPEVCFVGITTRTYDAPVAGGYSDPIPDPSDPGGGAVWKKQSSTRFFEIKARLGGSLDIDAGMFSTGSNRMIDVLPELNAQGMPIPGGQVRYYPAVFDIQFGWIANAGGLEVRYPSSGYDGDGKTLYNIEREKVINVDLTEFQDVPEATQESGSLGARLMEIATETHRTISKVPKVGQITLYGLDFEQITYIARFGLPTLVPFTYYLTLDIDQKDIETAVGIASTAACVQVRIDFDNAQTILDLTEDRSGIQGDLVGKLISDFRAEQLIHDVRSSLAGFRSFRECIGAGNSGGGSAGGSGALGVSGCGCSPCETFIPNPDGGGFINFCLLIYRSYILAKKGGGGGEPPEKQPQQAGAIMLRPGDHGITPAGGSPQVSPDDDRNAITDIFDEIPPGYVPPIVEGDFVPRGAEYMYDAKNQRTVGEFYGKHNRYKWLGASLAPDGIRWQRDESVIPCDGGRINGFVTAFAKDMLGWDRELDLELSEDEEAAAGIYSVPSQTLNLRNTSFARWKLYMADEIPPDVALYLDFEEASGSLYDLGPYKQALAASGSPTYGATGLLTGERGITTVQGSSSFAIASVAGGSPLVFGRKPAHVHVRFKINTLGITHALITNGSGSPFSGWKLEITTGNQLRLTFGDGTNESICTHGTVMTTGVWYSFRVLISRAAGGIYQSDGTTASAVSPNLVDNVATSGKAFTVSGSVTWDELVVVSGNIGTQASARTLAPTSWSFLGPVVGQEFVSIDTADANGGTAAVVVSIASGVNTSPVLMFQDTATVPDLILIPGHTYRLTIKVKTGVGTIVIAPWIENIDQRQLLTTAGAFTDTDTALTLTAASAEWSTNVIVFTVPTTFSAYDRWRIGARGSVAAGTVTMKFAGAPAFLLEEIPVTEEATEYALVDSDGVRVAELDADGAVVAS
jgi:hypothetical protein